MTSLHRRGLLRTAVGGSALLLIGPRTGVAQPGSPSPSASASPSLGASPVALPAASPVGAGAGAAEVDAGLAYFRGRAAEQTSLAER